MTNAKLQLEIKQANEISLLVCKGKVYSDKEWISKESLLAFMQTENPTDLEIVDKWYKLLDNIVHNVKGKQEND